MGVTKKEFRDRMLCVQRWKKAKEAKKSEEEYESYMRQKKYGKGGQKC